MMKASAIQLIFFLAIAIASLGYGQAEEISITLFATDLTKCGGQCSGYVKIFCSNVTSDWKQCGRTAVKKNNNFPIWEETFTFEHTEGTSERWRFDVMDQKLLFDDQIGSATISVDEFAAAIVKPIRRDLNSRGYLNIMQKNLAIRERKIQMYNVHNYKTWEEKI